MRAWTAAAARHALGGARHITALSRISFHPTAQASQPSHSHCSASRCLPPQALPHWRYHPSCDKSHLDQQLAAMQADIRRLVSRPPSARSPAADYDAARALSQQPCADLHDRPRAAEARRGWSRAPRPRGAGQTADAAAEMLSSEVRRHGPRWYRFPPNVDGFVAWTVRARPALSAPVVGTIKVGEVFHAADSTAADGLCWLRVGSGAGVAPGPGGAAVPVAAPPSADAVVVQCL